MKPIIILEPNVANKIAAGEVVERPASIVKELLENSLDAGATAITVEIRGGGVDYIRITDNGCGIPEADVSRAFLRHATSKLTSEEDLESILSFGFRGEALASIAAVSKVTMRTRTDDAEYGTAIYYEGGAEKSVEACACPKGTSIEVNELFYNVPARLKFIKSARTEAALITDYVSRIMLANINVSIKFINSGRTVMHTFGDGDLANAIFSVYGNGVFSSLYRVDYDDGYMRINGYVGGEITARSNRVQQSVFINHRYIKSMLISNAVQRAYLTRLMTHRFPFFVLDITISSREVDVNVHPNKLSVRFTDEERIASTITRAAAVALDGEKTQYAYSPQSIIEEGRRFAREDNPIGQEPASKTANAVETAREAETAHEKDNENAHGITADVEKKVRSIFSDNPLNLTAIRKENDGMAMPSGYTASSKDMYLSDSANEVIPSFSHRAEAYLNDPSLLLDRMDEKTSLNSPDEEISINTLPVYKVDTPEIKYRDTEFSKPAMQLEFDAEKCHIIGTAFDTYIIVQQGNSVFYIDQHAAHERILYEKLIAGELKFNSQMVAPPMVVQLDPISYECVVRNMERFIEFGYSIEEKDDGKLFINAVPSIQDAGTERFLRDAIDMLIDYPATAEIDLLRERIIKMSCKRAVKAGNRLDIKQLQAIVDAYSTGEVPLTCPHGRPVLIEVTKTDLEKMFKRIV